MKGTLRRLAGDPWRRLAPFAVALIACAFFAGTLRNGFVNWDDAVNFTSNPHYRGFSWEHLRWMFDLYSYPNYIPLSWLSAALDYALWGMNPAGYHLTNVLLHALTAALFYRVVLFLLRLRRGVAPERDWRAGTAAAFAALLFAIHPLRVESVAWITERRDVLSGALVCLTLLLYLKASAVENAARRFWLGLSLTAYALSLLAKSIGMTLPAILIVLDVYPLKRFGRATLVEKIPFACLAAAAAAAAFFGQQSFSGQESLAAHPVLAARLARTFYGFAFYPWKTLLPFGLSPLYELPQRLDPFAPRFLIAAAAVIAATAAAFAARRSRPAPAAAWLLYLAALAPVSGFFSFGHALVADRYSYLSCMPFAALAGAGLLAVLDRAAAAGAKAVLAVAAVWLAALGGLTWRQAGYWRDSGALWRRALELDPRNYVAHRLLADYLVEQGPSAAPAAEIEDLYREGIRLRPEERETHVDYGDFLARLGRREEAEAEYRDALSLDGSYAQAYERLGLLLLDEGKSPQALELFRRASALKPGLASARNNAGNALFQMGRGGEAVAEFDEALRLMPDFAEAHYNLANALNAAGDLGRAIPEYRDAVRCGLDTVQVRGNLGVALARAGDKDGALREFQAALALSPGNADVIRNLKLLGR